MNGTEWTEPGQGATNRELFRACQKRAFDGKRITRKQWDAVSARLHVAGVGSTETEVVFDWTLRTNLRLTGSPLTAEDLRRVEQAEVTR